MLEDEKYKFRYDQRILEVYEIEDDVYTHMPRILQDTRPVSALARLYSIIENENR